MHDSRVEKKVSDNLLVAIDTASAEYDALNALQKFGVRAADQTLQTAHSLDMIDAQHLHGDVVDFGCGVGGSSWLLKKNGANVTAIDTNGQSLDELRKLGTIDSDHIKGEDGIAYLNSLPESSLDMVTAFMLGPDSEGDFVRDFYLAANHAIKPTGRIIVQTEADTMRAMRGLVPDGFDIFEDRAHVFIGLKNTSGKLRDAQTNADPFDSFGTDFGIGGDSLLRTTLLDNLKPDPEVNADYTGLIKKFKLNLDKK